jgi:beta-lactam-binding protein with PASTA domain
VKASTPGRALAVLTTAILALLASAPPVAAAEEERQDAGIANGHAKGVVIVGFEPGASNTKRNRAEDAVDATDAEPVSPLATNVVVMELPPGQTVEQAIETLEAQPGVKYAEPDYYVVPAETSDDPGYTGGNQWGMYGDGTIHPNQYGTGAGEAWAAGAIGDDDVFVAVIDGGVQSTHADLDENMWNNPFEIAANGLDDDGNGFTDDVRGWDFFNDDATVFDAPGADGHATHVAGTIGAEGGNQAGVAGVNWRVTIIPLKFIGPGNGFVSDAIAALDYVTDLKVRHGLNIVATNNSWACPDISNCPPSVPLQSAIRRAGDAGILFVAAAGNNGADTDVTPSVPAGADCTRTASNVARGWDCIVSVANLESNGMLASSSNRGASSVDLGAPGTGILSTMPGDTYGLMSGTSMAAPHVTGAIALCASLDPTAGPATLRERVFGSGTPTGSLDLMTVTGKRLDVGALVQLCGATVPDIEGLGAADAQAAIDAADLDPVREPDEFHATIPDGEVISQLPNAGRLRPRGSSVHFVVSRGRPAVPDVVGMPEAAAIDGLAAVTLLPGDRSEAWHATTLTGHVISTIPPAATLVDPGSQVAYVVSKGKPAVPDVVGMPEAAAIADLDAVTLVAGTRTAAHHADIADGRVIATTPAAGAFVDPGSAVDYVVSLGPIAVPSVVGLPQAAAATTLTTAGLAVGSVSQGYDAVVPADSVISQDPPAGDPVGPGHAVSFVVSLGPEPVPVPNVVGLVESTALSYLSDAGLDAGVRGEAYHATIAAGSIISTTPPADTLVPPGSEVAYVVSIGPILVPNVVGLSSEVAETTLTSAGLVVGTVTTATHDTVAAGSVISQEPAADEAVGPGHAVSYVVSLGPAAVAVPDVVASPAPPAGPAPPADPVSPPAAAAPPPQPDPESQIELTTVIVDDLSPHFTRRADGWRQASTGYQKHHYWVPARVYAARRVATWRPALAGPGIYRVIARIPPSPGLTRRATYKIQTEDGWARKVLDQGAHRGRWTSLGVYRLVATPLVKLTDRTGERPSLGRLVAFDAIRFVPLGPLTVASVGIPTTQAEETVPAPPTGPSPGPAAAAMPEPTPQAIVERADVPEARDPKPVEEPEPARTTEPSDEPGQPMELEPIPEPVRARAPDRTPEPDPRDGPQPGPKAEPKEPEPTPEHTPDPTPEPTPDPTPEPTPDPTPEPTPDPTPEPTPDPAPDSVPAESHGPGSG